MLLTCQVVVPSVSFIRYKANLHHCAVCFKNAMDASSSAGFCFFFPFFIGFMLEDQGIRVVHCPCVASEMSLAMLPASRQPDCRCS